MSRFQRCRRGLVVAISVVAAISLVGCGQSEPTAAKATSGERGASTADNPKSDNQKSEDHKSGEELTPTAILTRAAKETAEHKSFKMRMMMTADGVTAMDMTSLTSADGKMQKSTIKSDEIGEMTMIIIDGVVYYQFPGLPDGKEWVKMDSADMMGSMGIDPGALAEQNSNALAMLNDLSEDVEVVGEDKIEGMTSVHYLYTFDVDSMMKGALDNGVLDGDAADAADLFGGKSDMNVWVGEDGLIRRVAYEMNTSGGGSDMPGSFAYEMTFTDYGANLDFAAPDPSSTMSMSDLMTETS
ncbi:MAG: LppX_LprAFG lipoprotein [Microthrixaceae bacterium]